MVLSDFFDGFLKKLKGNKYNKSKAKKIDDRNVEK